MSVIYLHMGKPYCEEFVILHDVAQQSHSEGYDIVKYVGNIKQKFLHHTSGLQILYS